MSHEERLRRSLGALRSDCHQKAISATIHCQSFQNGIVLNMMRHPLL